MNLKDFFESEDYKKEKSVQKLDQGDTFINVEGAQIELVERTDKDGKNYKRYVITDSVTKEGFSIPFSLLKDIEKLVKKGEKKVRITRTGKTRDDTRYTVVGVSDPQTT